LSTSTTCLTSSTTTSDARHYNYFRDYDPSIGRYLESDPIGLQAGLNTYAYVDAAPLSSTDPLALASYMCTKPLNALGSVGKLVYNPSWNPLYHQYICVGTSCGGQDRGDDGKGKPSKDYFRPDSCEKVDDRDCVDKCLLKRVSDDNRPNYSLFMGGGRNAGSYNCQQWADRQLLECRKECKGK
jgi:RHS repeat-associated protein